MLSTHICYRLGSPPEYFEALNDLPFEVGDCRQNEKMYRYTKFFQLINDSHCANAIGPITDTVITKADVIGREDD